ncbi:MAG: serine/threonine protein kinase [Myxococcales bacterium]|nr:serine/threonine protein kinase [Myxococcales bacterium]
MSTTPTQRYEVVERLDAGGMAEVFRGRAISIEGFEKQVAIKRVLPHLAKNQKFVNMFLDEAKLSLFLDHANVVSVFDLGRAADTYFIVMEFIDGPNLKRLLEWARDHKERLPVELAVYIAIEMCKGLDYAHTKRDASGHPLHIVHRDISPPNVILSRQGEVKVTDFGLAKAQSQIEVTDPGVVKGKFGYLSPEAALGQEIDQRTDVFAVGIVLWEMLIGKRLFQGKTDLETLQLVRKAEIPPMRPMNSGVHPDLEAIVRRALAREPKDRIVTAREMGTLLTRYLFSQGVSVTSYDLAAFVARVLDGPLPAEDSGQRRVMSTVIQEEINKLIRIESKDMSSSLQFDGGTLEDPRTWGDFAFDELPPSNVAAGRGSAYASRGVDAVAAAEPVTRVRTGLTQRNEVVPSRPDPTPPPRAASTPPRPLPAAAPPRRMSLTEEADAVQERRAKTVFYALFVVVALVGAYVAFLLMHQPT